MFDQDAKGRVVPLVEDRILAENLSMQQACQAAAPKLGVSWHAVRQWTQQARHDEKVPDRVPEDFTSETPGYDVRIKSFAIHMSC